MEAYINELRHVTFSHDRKVVLSWQPIHSDLLVTHRLFHPPVPAPESCPEPEAANGPMSDDVKYSAVAAFSAPTSKRIG